MDVADFDFLSMDTLKGALLPQENYLNGDSQISWEP